MKRTVIAIVKTISICLVIAAGSLLFVSYKTQKMYADLWQQLGISKDEGSRHIRESMMFGHLQFYGARNIKKIATGDRVAVAKELLEYTRQYVNSEAFKKEYRATRESARPVPPPPPRSEEEIRKNEIDQVKEGIKSMEDAIKTGPAEYKKMYEDNIKLYKERLKEYEDPKSQYIKLLVQSEMRSYEQQKGNYEDDLKEWQETMPENPMVLVKKRLQELLEVTRDVDFNAALVEKYGKKRFVKPEYENKPSNWKYAFRAGKEVTQTVRAFAEQWLKEIK